MPAQHATLVVRCTGDPTIPSVLDNLTLSEIEMAEGRAKGSGVVEEDIPPSVPTVGGLSRRGIVNYRVRVGTLGRAAGILRSRFTLTDPASGATRARCDTGTVRWSGRIAPRDAGRGRPVPAAGKGYFGTTAQGLPFVLEVAAERTRRASRGDGLSRQLPQPGRPAVRGGVGRAHADIARQAGRSGPFRAFGRDEQAVLIRRVRAGHGELPMAAAGPFRGRGRGRKLARHRDRDSRRRRGRGGHLHHGAQPLARRAVECRS